MAKAIKTEDGTFRYRRGKLVRIPDAWVGRKTDRQTIRKRRSKGLGGTKNGIRVRKVIGGRKGRGKRR